MDVRKTITVKEIRPLSGGYVIKCETPSEYWLFGDVLRHTTTQEHWRINSLIENEIFIQPSGASSEEIKVGDELQHVDFIPKKTINIPSSLKPYPTHPRLNQ